MAAINHKRKKKIISGINKPWGRYFSISERVSCASKSVLIVKSTNYSDFIKNLSGGNIRPDIACLIILILSGGLRISEALSIQYSDLEYIDGKIFVSVRVLKKRGRVTRKFIVHPDGQETVESYIKGLRGFERLFKFTRQNAYYHARKVFGESFDLHSLRHSHASYLLHLDMTHLKISKLLKLSVKMVERYSHLDYEHELSKLYT